MMRISASFVLTYCIFMIYTYSCDGQYMDNNDLVLKLNPEITKHNFHISSLNDYNSYKSKFKNFKITLIEKNDTDYQLNVYSKNDKLLYKSICQGISKIYEDSTGVYFVEYDLFTEDGHSSGTIFTFNSESQKILKSKIVLSNCTNPIKINDAFLIISGMELLKLGNNLEIKSRSKIKLIKATKVVNSLYEESLLFCDLDNDKNEIIVNFSVNRSKLICKRYVGMIDINQSISNMIINLK